MNARSSPGVSRTPRASANLASFTTYGLEACYRFHNFELEEDSAVELGGSLTGRLVRYLMPDSHRNWLALYWEWPVRVPGAQRYERVVMSVDSSSTTNQLDRESLVALAKDMVVKAADRASQTKVNEF